MTKKNRVFLITIIFVFIFLLGIFLYRMISHNEIILFKAKDNDLKINNNINIKSNFILNESATIESSDSGIWWLNSGGEYLESKYLNGTSSTFLGKMPKSHKWNELYNSSNPRDTDNGEHPQNIFRLITLSKFQNTSQQVYYLVIRDNLSYSSYRNASNGLLLFNRYQDGENLYYTGVRVDGYAVIKKKIKGVYFTMAYEKVFDGIYNRQNNPSLLPKNQWLGIKSEVKTLDNGNVEIKVFLDKNRTNDWKLVAQAIDDGTIYGGKAILKAGYGGIRTDFMDVEFDDYNIIEQ